MDNQKALEILTDCRNCLPPGAECQVAIDIAILALKKQIPICAQNTDYDFSFFECPNCGTAVYATGDFSDHNYCLNCGQAILWKRPKANYN